MGYRRKMFEEDMKAVQRDTGDPVTIDGDEYDAVVGDISQGTVQQLEGYLPDVTASFTFVLSDFKGNPPTAQSKVVYEGVTYRVLVPVQVPKGASIVLECGAKQA